MTLLGGGIIQITFPRVMGWVGSCAQYPHPSGALVTSSDERSLQ
jgi:hypothetical protein